jgi:hypothetical protein
LRQSHLKPEWIGAVKALAQHVPSVSDMVRFATREAYEGGSELSGTAAELPASFVADAKRQGLTERDAEHYWASHWHLPSPTQAYQMLHRKLIGESTLSELLRVSDYPPFWRDKLASIAYHVPDRVDLRRMLEHGVIDEARVHKGYLDLGYTEADAAILTSSLSSWRRAPGRAARPLAKLPRRILLRPMRVATCRAREFIGALEGSGTRRGRSHESGRGGRSRRQSGPRAGRRGHPHGVQERQHHGGRRERRAQGSGSRRSRWPGSCRRGRRRRTRFR